MTSPKMSPTRSVVAWPGLDQRSRKPSPPRGRGLKGASCHTAQAVLPAAFTAAPAEIASARLRTCLVHRDPPSVHLRLVKLGNRLGCLLIGRHLDEREAPRSTRVPVGHDIDCLGRADLGEELLELGFTRRIGMLPT